MTLYQDPPDPLRDALTALNGDNRVLKATRFRLGDGIPELDKAIADNDACFEIICRSCFKPSKDMYCLKCDHVMGDLGAERS